MATAKSATPPSSTLQALPADLIAGFIARSDVPTELREFFVSRGIQPSDTPSPDFDEPIVDTSIENELGLDGTEDQKQASFQERLANMTVPEKMKCAMKGTREMRAILIRDPNRLVSSAVLSCPKVNAAEVEAFAKMGNVSEDILRTIAMSRAWTKSYSVVLSLVKNSKTPGGAELEPDAAAHRERRQEDFDRPERPGGAAVGRAEADGRGLEEVVTPPRDACAHSERICARPSM